MILDKLDKLTRQEKTGLVVALAFVFLLLVDRIVVESVIGTLSELNDEIAATSDALDYSRTVLKDKDVVTKEYAKVSGLMEVVESEAMGIEQMKVQIDAMTSKTGVKILSWEHRDPVPRDSYKEYVLDIRNYEGNITNVLGFLYQMHDEALVGLPRINKVTIAPGIKKKGDGEEEHVLRGSMLITKVVREQESIE
jgi:hypothetical protein